MRNLKMHLRYCGTRYHGFQVQKNALSVCEVFQDAVERVFGQRLDVKGCSRTDSGVHANEYVISMRCESGMTPDKVVLALNAHLPEDVVVFRCEDAAEDFHARYSATGKEYLYLVHNSRVRDPFAPHLSYRWGFPLDEAMLDAQAKAFVGRRDFAAMQAQGSDIEDTVRTVYACDVVRVGEQVRFVVRGDGFLYKMVRIMVGTLLHIAAGRIEPGAIPAILAGGDRGAAGKTAPACGLYLNRVFYTPPERWDEETNQ